MDFALNNLQGLICHKTLSTNQQLIFHPPPYIYIYLKNIQNVFKKYKLYVFGIVLFLQLFASPKKKNSFKTIQNGGKLNKLLKAWTEVYH